MRESDRTDAFFEALVSAVSELSEQDGAQAIDPLETSDLFLKQLKARLKGWKVFDWDFLSRKAGTLEIDLRVKSPDGKVQRRPHASIQASDGKFSATFVLGRKGKKGTAKGTSLKDITSKIAAGLGSALSGLKEDTMPDTFESVLEELLNFCTEKKIELESEDLDDLMEELGEWMCCPDLTEEDVSALGQFVERLKKMIVMMLKKKPSKEGELPGDAGDAGDDGEDDEEVDERAPMRELASDLRELVVEKKEKLWIQKAIDPKMKGALRKALKTKKGEVIPAGKLKAAAKKPGKVGKRARLALTLKKLAKRKGK